MLVRRFGRPGLLGTMARTAVIAGTATATANALNRRQARNAEQDAEAAAYEQQQAAAQAAPAPVAAADPDAGLGDQLLKLAQLHQDGTLTDAEFAAAKQRLLG
jgi:putative oligomerization/nucleic acid binding protein